MKQLIANESVSQKPVDKDDVLRVADPTLADIERLTGLKPSESIQEAERQQSIPSQAQQENNAIQSNIEGKNNRKQKHHAIQRWFYRITKL